MVDLHFILHLFMAGVTKSRAQRRLSIDQAQTIARLSNVVCKSRRRARRNLGLLSHRQVLSRQIRSLTLLTLLLVGSTSCVALRGPECDTGSRVAVVVPCERLQAKQPSTSDWSWSLRRARRSHSWLRRGWGSLSKHQLAGFPAPLFSRRSAHAH